MISLSLFLDILALIGMVLVFIGGISASRFVWHYRRPPFDWKTYEAGRHLMKFTRGIAIILAWSALVFLLRIWFEGDPWFEIAVAIGRIVIFGYVAWMMTSRLEMLLKSRDAVLQHEGQVRS